MSTPHLVIIIVLVCVVAFWAILAYAIRKSPLEVEMWTDSELRTLNEAQAGMHRLAILHQVERRQAQRRASHKPGEGA